jgi:hypothetical protein
VTFAPKAEIGILENEVWDLSKPSAYYGIVGCEFDISFPENVTDVSGLWRHTVIVAPSCERRRGYPRSIGVQDLVPTFSAAVGYRWKKDVGRDGTHNRHAP